MNTPNLLLSLLLSAAVAALVTLLIEYAAKPSLEARKERILRDRRALWELRDALVILEDRLYWTRKLARHQEDVELTVLEAQIDRVFRDLDEAERLATVAQEAIPTSIRAELSFSFGRHAVIAEMVEEIRQNLPPPQRREAYALALYNLGANLQLPMEYLTTPRKRFRRRRSLLREATEREEERDREMPDDDEDEDDVAEDRPWVLIDRLKRMTGDSRKVHGRDPEEES